jgi:hypothetical protein
MFVKVITRQITQEDFKRDRNICGVEFMTQDSVWYIQICYAKDLNLKARPDKKEWSIVTYNPSISDTKGGQSVGGVKSSVKYQDYFYHGHKILPLLYNEPENRLYRGDDPSVVGNGFLRPYGFACRANDLDRIGASTMLDAELTQINKFLRVSKEDTFELSLVDMSADTAQDEKDYEVFQLSKDALYKDAYTLAKRVTGCGTEELQKKIEALLGALEEEI